MKDGLLERIKSHGYWRINFQPVVDLQKLSSMKDCREMVEKNVLSLRGWDFPHIPRRNDDEMGSEPCGTYYETWTQWEAFNEFWRMYKSGQFLFYFSLHEDWYTGNNGVQPGTKLNIIGSAIYTLTEVYEFLSRLVMAGLYNEGVKVNLSLNNTKGRELWLTESMRTPFFQTYKTGAENIELKYDHSKEEILSKSKELALNAMRDLFDNFGWENPSSVLTEEQDKLLSGRI